MLISYIFECNYCDLKKFATQLTAEVTRQQNNRNNSRPSTSTTTTTEPSTNSQTSQTPHARGRTRVTRSAAASQADTMAALFAGGRRNPVEHGKHRSYPYATTHLRFRPPKLAASQGNADHTALKAAADKALAYQVFPQQATSGKKKKEKKVQSQHPLFEASTVILARYLQAGIIIRSKLFWKSASSQRSNVGHG